MAARSKAERSKHEVEGKGSLILVGCVAGLPCGDSSANRKEDIIKRKLEAAGPSSKAASSKHEVEGSKAASSKREVEGRSSGSETGSAARSPCGDSSANRGEYPPKMRDFGVVGSPCGDSSAQCRTLGGIKHSKWAQIGYAARYPTNVLCAIQG